MFSMSCSKRWGMSARSLLCLTQQWRGDKRGLSRSLCWRAQDLPQGLQVFHNTSTRTEEQRHWARPKVHLAPVSNSGQKQNAWGKVWAQGKHIQYFPWVLSQPPAISRLEISGAKYVFMYLEPCKQPWVVSFNSPCASPNPCALSRLILSDLLFICPPDTLHPLHAESMPLQAIHLNFPPWIFLLSSNFTTADEKDA